MSVDELCDGKKAVSDVYLEVELGREQQDDIMEVLRKPDKIFTDIPGKTSTIEHALS